MMAYNLERLPEEIWNMDAHTFWSYRAFVNGVNKGKSIRYETKS